MSILKPYRIIDCLQRSPEWHKWRQWKIGASMAPIIMEESPWEMPLQLYQRIVEGIDMEVNSDMQRGIDLESDALLLINFRMEADFKPCCFESSEYPWAICSADGFDANLNVGCEIKSPRKFSREICNQTVPVKYRGQLQHSMMVTGSPHWHYAEYVNGSLLIRAERRDDEYIERLTKAEKEFYERLMNFSKPRHGFEEEWSKLL